MFSLQNTNLLFMYQGLPIHFSCIKVHFVFFLTTMSSSSSSQRPRRPPSSIEAITVSNTLDEDNNWTKLTISKGSWILLQTRKRKILFPNVFLDHWKARVKDFWLQGTQKTIREVLVQHVYMHKELSFGTWPEGLPQRRPNCKCSVFINNFLVDGSP